MMEHVKVECPRPGCGHVDAYGIGRHQVYYAGHCDACGVHYSFEVRDGQAVVTTPTDETDDADQQTEDIVTPDPQRAGRG